jgi:hypothetical protein
MTDFIPRGYVSVDEALDHLGSELFGSEWTGKEQNARTNLIGADEWRRIKNLAPARGSDAPGSAPHRKAAANSNTNSPHSTGNPASDSYQREYHEGKRYEAARDRLRVMLEGGDLEAAILDPFTGTLHRAATTLWRRSGADRMIKKGQAPIPRSPNMGSIIIRELRAADSPAKPMPTAKIREAIEALREELATKSLTRPQQAQFVRKKFSGYRVTERQLRTIYQSVSVPPGRPKQKSDTAGA